MKDLSKSLSIHLPTHCDTKNKKGADGAPLLSARSQERKSRRVSRSRQNFQSTSQVRGVFFLACFFLRVFLQANFPRPFILFYFLSFIFYLLSYIYREKIDTDGDGSISKEEFIRGYSIWQMHIKKAQMLQVSFFFFTKQ